MVKLQARGHYAVGWAAEAEGGPIELARVRSGAAHFIDPAAHCERISCASWCPPVGLERKSELVAWGVRRLI
jgi:hypothetical protein